MRGHFLVHVARVLGQRAFEHKISFVPWILTFAALDRPLKVERHSVNNLRREAQLVPFQLAALEELIQKCTLVALSVAESRNESRDLSRILRSEERRVGKEGR